MMSNKYFLQRWGIVFPLSLLIGILILDGCKGSGTILPNIPPETRLSNIPPPDTFIVTQNPRLTLFWVGDDPDGFVVAFKYRWNFRLSANDTFQHKPWKTLLNIIVSKFALIMEGDEKVAPTVYKYFATLPPEGLDVVTSDALARGDTIVIEGVRVYASNPDYERYPVHKSPNSGTFIFDSQDTLNPHTFEVAAIDNVGELDPAPATVSFGTPQVVPPKSEITEFPTDTVLVLDRKTPTFSGIRFAFQGFDPNSRTLDYQWVVDKELWPQDRIPWSDFSPLTEAYIIATDIPDPYASKHTFYVRARNEFGSIDTIGYFIRARLNNLAQIIGYDTIYSNKVFYTIYPPFQRTDIPYEKRILLINNSYDWDTLATSARPSKQMMDNFYQSVFSDLGKDGKYDVVHSIDLPNLKFFPGRGMLGKYSTVFLFSDATNEFSNHGHQLTPGRQNALKDYCYIGGKLIMSGWAQALPTNTPNTDIFFQAIPHMQDMEPNNDTDYVGAKGVLGYPDASLDPTKLDPTWNGALYRIYIGRPSGFGEIIYRFDSKTNRCVTRFGPTGPVQFCYEDQPVGIRYIGITYNIVFLGFPLYYTNQTTAVAVLRKALQDIGEF
ncbi:MAG TPA: hypothetical protein VFF29_05265 [Bacteroidota bacterium]|nr:hypothetical protein [Bacteroidota bacterium]